MKIVDIDGENLSYLLNDLRNENKFFRKYVTYDNIKGHKNVHYTHSGRCIFWISHSTVVKLTPKSFKA